MLTQRLGSTTQMDDKFISEFIRIVKEHPGSCDEVWLATKYGFPKPEVHREMAEKLAVTAKRLRDEGLRVSLQISNTIGHGQYMSGEDCSGLVFEGSPIENIVGPDGTVSRYCFCWHGKFFRDYVVSEVRTYASLIQPHTVWIDDDLRATNHNPVEYGCFCDNCIARYNKRFGTAFDRAGLVEAINYGDPIHRENYVQFLRDGLYDFTYEVFTAIHEVSPDSFAGFQHATNGGYTGRGLAYVFDAMREATGKEPKSRPGGGYYDDHDPNGFLDKADCLAYQSSLLPDYVKEVRPEIENLPDVKFGKTIAGTCYETSLYLATGATAMSYAMLMEDYEEMDWHGEMLGAFASHRKYWEALAKASQNSIRAGVTMATGREIWRRDIRGEAPFKWSDEPYMSAGQKLRGLAIPLTFNETSHPVYLIHPDYVAGLTDAEIEDLLTKPVILDGEAFARLCWRGYAGRFSAKAEAVSTGQLAEEYNLSHPANLKVKKQPRHTWSQNFYYGGGYRLVGETEPIGWFMTFARNVKPLCDDPEHPYGVCNGIVTTDKGAKWAVFGHYFWNQILSLAKRDQILGAIDYISGNALPAIIETGAQTELYPRENAEGKVTSVSVLNRTVGESGVLTIRVRRPALSEGQTAIRFLAQYHDEENVGFTRDGEDILVKMPSLKPWTLGTLFIK